MKANYGKLIKWILTKVLCNYDDETGSNEVFHTDPYGCDWVVTIKRVGDHQNETDQ